MEKKGLSSKYHTIVPVIFGGRVATFICRASEAFTDEDLRSARYGATVVGIEVAQEELHLRKRKTTD